MRSNILSLLAVGLAGLDGAVGSVCKPRSMASGSSTAATTIAFDLYSSTFSVATSATFTGTTTESIIASDTTTGSTTLTQSAVTTEVATSSDMNTGSTTVTESDTTTGSATTTEVTVIETATTVTSSDMNTGSTTVAESDTTTGSARTTEATTVTETATTTEAVTSSDMTTGSTTVVETTTTTGPPTTFETVTTSGTVSASETTTTAVPTTTSVPMFRLVAESGTYANQPILSNRRAGDHFLMDPAQGYTDAYFTVDATTGQLLLDDVLPVCGFFPGDGTSALEVCWHVPQEANVICETPTTGQIHCRVPEQSCGMFSGCQLTGGTWGTTYIGESGGYPQKKPLLGPSSKQEVPFLIKYGSA